MPKVECEMTGFSDVEQQSGPMRSKFNAAFDDMNLKMIEDYVLMKWGG